MRLKAETIHRPRSPRNQGSSCSTQPDVLELPGNSEGYRIIHGVITRKDEPNEFGVRQALLGDAHANTRGIQAVLACYVRLNDRLFLEAL